MGLIFREMRMEILHIQERAPMPETESFITRTLQARRLQSHLYEQCKKLDNLTIKEHWTMVDLLTKDNCCYGVVVRKDDGSL